MIGHDSNVVSGKQRPGAEKKAKRIEELGRRDGWVHCEVEHVEGLWVVRRQQVVTDSFDDGSLVQLKAKFGERDDRVVNGKNVTRTRRMSLGNGEEILNGNSDVNCRTDF